MADIRCPMCSKSASDELDICPFCQARLKPIIISTPSGDESILPGQEPVKKDTSDLEMADPSRSSREEGPIRPGDAPTKKDTAELEFALPAWLRKLRGQTSEKTPVDESQEPEENLDEIQEIPESPESPESSGSPGITAEDVQESPDESEAMDWLSGLKQTAQEEDDTPAWLSGIKDISPVEQPDVEPISDIASQEEDNWLDSLRSEPTGPEQETESAQAESLLDEPVLDEGVPEWMKKLQAEVDNRDAVSEPKSEQQFEEEKEDSPDWLTRLQNETQSNAASSEGAVSGQADETPDWLDKMSAEIPATADESSLSGSETPDWLRNLQSETQAFSEEEQPSGSEFVEEQMEAVAETLETVQEGGLPSAEMPEWLKGVQSESQAFPEEEQPSGSEFVEDQVEAVAENQETVQEGGLPSAEMPEWLKSMQAETQAFSDEDRASEPVFVDDQMEAGAESLEITDESGPLAAEMPGWLQEMASDSQLEPLQEADQPGEETPEWLKSMGSELQDAPQSAEPAWTAEDLADFRPGMTPSPEGELDEWDSEVGDPALIQSLDEGSEFFQQNVEERSAPELDDQQLDSELMPDWLKNVEKTDTIASEIPAMIPDEQFTADGSGELLSTEMPGWIKSLKPDDESSQPEEEESQIEPSDSEILPAELPSWVQAMRPVESMVADVGLANKHLEQITEKVGPLAGLQGVLPASPGLGKLRKPLNYSIKLRVSDDQSVQADQLEKMLGVESTAKSTTSVDRKLSQRILRWVMAALVFLVVALPILGGNQITSASSIYPPELVAAREILFKLPPSSPVLLVFDYEPAYSGELEVTSAPMVDNLLFSGARLAILSTSPTGPILAEYFLKTTQAQHNIQSGQHYANLGYLAGGASGVLSFALNPSQTIPRALDDSQPWQTPLLQDINTIADFKAVIVLTDNPDTARIWVEQVGTLMGETPLLMAISAQAEPMIRPYYDSMQIKGLVTGLAGGKAYEQALQLSGLGRSYWDSFSSGLFLAELVILMGGLWSVVSIWRNRKSVLEEEA